MRPSLAASRKQARHIPKSRMKARLRPQRKQRRTTRDLNFGGRLLRATVDFLAIRLKYSPCLESYDSDGLPRLSTKRHLSEKRSPNGRRSTLSQPLPQRKFLLFGR